MKGSIISREVFAAHLAEQEVTNLKRKLEVSENKRRVAEALLKVASIASTYRINDVARAISYNSTND